MSYFCRNKRNFFFTVFICLLSVSVLAGGCTPLRKKFIRQKKKDQETSEIVPILEPIDYPDVIHTAVEDYKQRYALSHVWHREFLNALEEDSNLKQELYSLDQLIVQLQQMQKLLVPEKSSKLSTLITQFETLKEDLAVPRFFNNTTNVKLKAELLEKQFRENYRLNRVKEFLVK